MGNHPSVQKGDVACVDGKFQLVKYKKNGDGDPVRASTDNTKTVKPTIQKRFARFVHDLSAKLHREQKAPRFEVWDTRVVIRDGMVHVCFWGQFSEASADWTSERAFTQLEVYMKTMINAGGFLTSNADASHEIFLKGFEHQ